MQHAKRTINRLMAVCLLPTGDETPGRRPWEHKMNTAHTGIVLAAWLVAGISQAAAGQGLAFDADDFGPRWQARLQLTADGAPALSLTHQLRNFIPWRTRSAAVFGDYYVAQPWLGEAGGLRITSGLLTGQRGAVLGPSAAAQLDSNLAASVSQHPGHVPSSHENPGEPNLTWPYLGIGYSGSSLRGGWGFSADLGLAAQNPGAIRLGRVTASAGFDDWVREMRLTPLVQLGVSYKF